MYWGGDGLVGICRPPFIPGHEFVGRIAEVGSAVTEWKVGDRVVAEQIVPCGHCRFCKTGKYWMCQNRGGFGFYVEFGVFADTTTVNWSLIGDRKELDIRGAHLSPYCYPFVIENIANGRLKTDGIVSSVFPVEEWEKAYDAASGKYGDYKVAIKF